MENHIEEHINNLKSTIDKNEKQIDLDVEWKKSIIKIGNWMTFFGICSVIGIISSILIMLF